jgi:hypothetical protein
MATLITVAQADAHLRLDLDLTASPPDDPRIPDVELKMDQAEAIVLDYLKVDDDVLDGSPPGYLAGSPPLWGARDLKVIQSAILLILSALWDDSPDRTVADYMKQDGTIALLLARLRDPALA